MMRILSACSYGSLNNLVRNCYFFSKNFKEMERNVFQPIQSKFQIIGKEKINHDCYIYKFHFDGPSFPLRIGQHFRFNYTLKTFQHPEGEELLRYYTPISTCKDFENDKIEVLIKIYRPNQDPLLPQGGKFTPFLEKLNVGQKLDIQGPFGKFTYESPGKVEISKTPFAKTKTVQEVKRIFFIAGGTGITPIFQTINQIYRLPQDKTQIVLLFCNKSQKDIILRKELEAMQPRLKLIHMLEKAPADWSGLQGRINQEVLNKICPLNDPDTFYLYCGPKGMNIALSKLFEQNYADSNHFKI